MEEKQALRKEGVCVQRRPLGCLKPPLGASRRPSPRPRPPLPAPYLPTSCRLPAQSHIPPPRPAASGRLRGLARRL